MTTRGRGHTNIELAVGSNPRRPKRPMRCATVATTSSSERAHFATSVTVMTRDAQRNQPRRHGPRESPHGYGAEPAMDASLATGLAAILGSATGASAAIA